MSKHDAEMFRQLRRTQGSPTRDPFSAPKFLRTPTLLCLEQLAVAQEPVRRAGDHCRIVGRGGATADAGRPLPADRAPGPSARHCLLNQNQTTQTEAT